MAEPLTNIRMLGWLARNTESSAEARSATQTRNTTAERDEREQHEREKAMSRGGESVGKRRITAQRNDRKAAKSERRQQRRQEETPQPADQGRIMARFHHLNELRSAGAITEDDFERQRHEIFVSLGLEGP